MHPRPLSRPRTYTQLSSADPVHPLPDKKRAHRTRTRVPLTIVCSYYILSRAARIRVDSRWRRLTSWRPSCRLLVEQRVPSALSFAFSWERGDRSGHGRDVPTERPLSAEAALSIGSKKENPEKKQSLGLVGSPHCTSRRLGRPFSFPQHRRWHPPSRARLHEQNGIRCGGEIARLPFSLRVFPSRPLSLSFSLPLTPVLLVLCHVMQGFSHQMRCQRGGVVASRKPEQTS